VSVRTIEVKAFEIAASPGVDPIRLIVQDLGPGQGSVIIECYGKAWSRYWGGMGNHDVLSFLRMVESDYLMFAVRHDKQTKAEDAYLLRIVKAVKAAIETYPTKPNETKTRPQTLA
jgi:hypothetical protein